MVLNAVCTLQSITEGDFKQHKCLGPILNFFTNLVYSKAQVLSVFTSSQVIVKIIQLWESLISIEKLYSYGSDSPFLNWHISSSQFE